MKRFYKDVAVEPADDGWQVTLDGRAIKTVGGSPQILPSETLAQALAQEWAGQGEEIDPSAFPLRDLADFAIDTVAQERAAQVEEIAGFAQTDTLCYRADPDEPLHRRQIEVWEPLLTEAERRWDIHFERICGIMHKPQPGETLDRMRETVEAQDDFTLAALRMLTGIPASLVIGLLALQDGADADELWRAANLEEDWQAAQWGSDAEAKERRQARFEAFALAMRFAAMARAG